MRAPAYTITNDSVVVVLKGETYTVKSGDTNFQPAIQAILSQQWDNLLPLFSKGKAIEEWAQGHFTFTEGFMCFKGERVPDELNTKMIGMAQKGTDPTYLMRFWERLQQNPSARSVEQLWPFLEHKGIPITKDGCFLAYKGVKSDYTDCHTGKFDNRPGATCEMPRNRISDDPRQACHFGFHVGAVDHAQQYGHRKVVCKVDPKDVVCIPYDASQQKMRVCKYVVVGNYGETLPDDIYEGDDVLDAKVKKPVQEELPLKQETDVKKEKEVSAPLNPESGDSRDTHPYMGRTLADLRVFAKKLGIKNVKAIRGGKPALVERILQVEKANQLPPVAPQRIEKQELEDIKPAKELPKEEPKDLYDYSDFSDEDLGKLSIGHLRKYAARVLKIVGASKIRGGKSVLLPIILNTRTEE